MVTLNSLRSPTPRPRVYIASPFRGASTEETRQNIVYARLCMLDSLTHGEAPYLSHLLYTQVWAETPALREAGMSAGDAWREVADLVAIYSDLGVTEGMRRAAESVPESRCVVRYLGKIPRERGKAPPTVEAWRARLANMALETFPALRS